MFEADLMAALRRLKRKLTFWRVIALAAMAGIMAVLLWREAAPGLSSHVARVRISGLITGQQRQIDLLDDLARSQRVKAVILRINSPGGTTVGSEALHDAIRRIAKKKPVVAVMDSVAASGGYIVALAADRIYARGNTLTGSIGVIFQWTELVELMDKIGVKMQAVKSGPLKAEPNPFTPLKPQVKKVTEELVQDSFRWFVDLVMQRRKMPRGKALDLADGRVFTGRQALKAGLIDALGDERAARRWLAEKRKVDKDLKTVEHKPRPLSAEWGLGFSMVRAALSFLGLGGLLADPAAARGSFALDGLAAIWHPALQLSRGR